MTDLWMTVLCICTFECFFFFIKPHIITKMGKEDVCTILSAC